MKCATRGIAGAVVAWLSLVCVLVQAAPQKAPRQQAGPTPGQSVEQSLAPAEVDDWPLDLSRGDWAAIAIQVIDRHEADDWPSVVVTAADGRRVFESETPDIDISVESWPRTVAAFIADRDGPFKLRVTAGKTPFRYRLTLDRRPSVDADSQRLQAYKLWHEGYEKYLKGDNDSVRAANEKYEAALQLLTTLEDEEGQALTLGTQTKIAYRLSDTEHAKPLAQRTLDLWKKLGRDREEAIAISDVGVVAYLAQDHVTAKKYYEEALPKHRAAGDLEGEGTTLIRLGWVYYALPDLAKALEVDEQALALFRQVGNENSQSIILNDIGRVTVDLGDVAGGMESFRQALVLRPPERDPYGAANILIRKGLLYMSTSEWQQGLDDLRQARAIAHSVHEDRTETAALVNLGSAHVSVGAPAEGAEFLQQALPMARAIKFRQAEAYALLWLGVGALQQQDAVRGADYFQQALALYIADKNVRGQVTANRHLAMAQLRLGQPQRALEAINKSVELTPQVGGLIYSNAMVLADVYAALGDTAKAQASYEEAISRYRGLHARHAEVFALTKYARFQASRGLNAEALPMLEQALAVYEPLRGLIVDPDLRMGFASTVDSYRLYIDVLMAMDRASPGQGYAQKAFHANERVRARGLLDLLATSGIDIKRGVDRTLVERERAQRWNLNAKAALQTNLLARKGDEKRLAAVENEIVELSRSWRDTVTAIRQQSPGYASLTAPEPLTATDVAKLLDDDTVLLEFAPGETHSWLFVVTTKSFESYELPAQNKIDAAAREVHDLLAARQTVPGENPQDWWARIHRADLSFNERAQALSDLVLGPIATKLAGDWKDRRLAIVAAGGLEYVPFSALPIPGRTPDDKADYAPLLAAHEVVSLPSATTLAMLRRDDEGRPPAAKTIAVIADPVFASDDPRVKQAPRQARNNTQSATRSDFARLPFTRSEAQAIAGLVPATSRLQATDFDASLALATSDRLNDYRIVHIATHGVINTTHPELSGLALSMVDPQGRDRDGFLRLNTIYNLRLSADLVVLSACQTALGKEVASEGLVGLTRGFMYAGAPRVMASLWQVSDVATAQLMKRFYTNMLRDNMSPAAALRAAQLDMSREPHWRAPYFWAGFVLQGDWRQ